MEYGVSLNLLLILQKTILIIVCWYTKTDTCHYVILAHKGKDTNIYGIVVEVFYDHNVGDETLHVGDQNVTFAFENFGTPKGFNFYNESVVISNELNYTK